VLLQSSENRVVDLHDPRNPIPGSLLPALLRLQLGIGIFHHVPRSFGFLVLVICVSPNQFFVLSGQCGYRLSLRVHRMVLLVVHTPVWDSFTGLVTAGRLHARRVCCVPQTCCSPADLGHAVITHISSPAMPSNNCRMVPSYMPDDSFVPLVN